jgi:hypothetical protein
MRQAITTKYIGPTNFRSARVKAKCQAGSITMSWDDALDDDDNHLKAAQTLCKKLDWHEHGRYLIAGGLPSGKGNAYVWSPKGVA